MESFVLRFFASFTILWNYTILKLGGPFCLNERSFTTLRNYTILKREFGVNAEFLSFTTLWNYTILKLTNGNFSTLTGFTTLWNYTILKPVSQLRERAKVLLPYEITLFSNSSEDFKKQFEFYYLMKLHYSQTGKI